MTETTEYDTPSTSLPDGPFKDWPGAGPTPEPEADDFRDKVIEAAKERRDQDKADYEERCAKAADFYGGTGEPEPTEPTEPEPYDPDNPTTPDPQTPAPTYGTSNPTPTTPTPTTTYGSSTPTTPTTPDPQTPGYTSGS